MVRFGTTEVKEIMEVKEKVLKVMAIQSLVRLESINYSGSSLL